MILIGFHKNHCRIHIRFLAELLSKFSQDSHQKLLRVLNRIPTGFLYKSYHDSHRNLSNFFSRICIRFVPVFLGFYQNSSWLFIIMLSVFKLNLPMIISKLFRIFIINISDIGNPGILISFLQDVLFQDSY